MKTKLIIASSLVVILAITFFSFKNMGEKESSNIALVNTVFGKPESTGFLINYGDGSLELQPFEFKRNSSENHLQGLSLLAQIINQMHVKGYRYVSTGSHTTNDLGTVMSYLVFEKK